LTAKGHKDLVISIKFHEASTQDSVHLSFIEFIRFYLPLISADNRRTERWSSAAPFGGKSLLLFVPAECQVHRKIGDSLRLFSFSI
jgi:hypothetical protein